MLSNMKMLSNYDIYIYMSLGLPGPTGAYCHVCEKWKLKRTHQLKVGGAPEVKKSVSVANSILISGGSPDFTFNCRKH